MRPTATVLVLLWVSGGSSAVQENCRDYRLQFERVFSVPGEVAMLNSTLRSPDVFPFATVPHNVTWYDPSGREVDQRSGPFLLRGETLWLLNVREEDAGEYECVIRTASRCFRQTTLLVVDPPLGGSCGRPRVAHQSLMVGVSDSLSCPLKDYIRKLDSYSIPSSVRWYRNCSPIEDGQGRFTYLGVARLKVVRVEPQDGGSYTCTLTFTLAGVAVSVSETIDAWVQDYFSLQPEVYEPSNEVIRAVPGSSFRKCCKVFIPSVGLPSAHIFWILNGLFVSEEESDRVHAAPQHSSTEEGGRQGVWLYRPLLFTELKDDDFYVNYTCRVVSGYDPTEGYFTLIHAEPDLLLPVWALLGGVVVLSVSVLAFYYAFKLEVVLWCRMSFPLLYRSTARDGKRFDAYVLFPRHCGIAEGGASRLEVFLLQTLPRVLEQRWGYKLFIPDRDCLPGQAVLDSMQEGLQTSRRLILIYTASTFTSNHSNHSNNNSDTSNPGNHSNNRSDTGNHSNHNTINSNTSNHSNHYNNNGNTSNHGNHTDNNSDINNHSTNTTYYTSDSGNHSNNTSGNTIGNYSNQSSNTSGNHSSQSSYTSGNHNNKSSNTSGHHCNQSSNTSGHLSNQSSNISGHHSNQRSNTSGHHSNHSSNTGGHHSNQSSHTGGHHNNQSCNTSGNHSNPSAECWGVEQRLQCDAAMHRVLMEGTLKVVLVEMEPVGPEQLTLFPESVRHLRAKQGALRCWRRSPAGWRGGWGLGWGGPEAVTMTTTSKFWKEMRYHMPVRGKRRVGCPKNSVLLPLGGPGRRDGTWKERWDLEGEMGPGRRDGTWKDGLDPEEEMGPGVSQWSPDS